MAPKLTSILPLRILFISTFQLSEFISVFSDRLLFAPFSELKLELELELVLELDLYFYRIDTLQYYD